MNFLFLACFLFASRLIAMDQSPYHSSYQNFPYYITPEQQQVLHILTNCEETSRNFVSFSSTLNSKIQLLEADIFRLEGLYIKKDDLKSIRLEMTDDIGIKITGILNQKFSTIINDLKSENVGLRQMVSSLQTRNQVLDKAIITLQEEMKSLRQDFATMQDSIKSVQKKEVISPYSPTRESDKIKTLENDLRSLKKDLSILQEKYGELKSSGSQTSLTVKTLLEKLNETSEKVKSAQEHSENTKKFSDRLKKDIEKLTGDVDSKISKVQEEKKIEKSTLIKALSELKNKLKQMGGKAEHQATECASQTDASPDSNNSSAINNSEIQLSDSSKTPPSETTDNTESQEVETIIEEAKKDDPVTLPTEHPLEATSTSDIPSSGLDQVKIYKIAERILLTDPDIKKVNAAQKLERKLFFVQKMNENSLYIELFNTPILQEIWCKDDISEDQKKAFSLLLSKYCVGFSAYHAMNDSVLSNEYYDVISCLSRLKSNNCIIVSIDVLKEFYIKNTRELQKKFFELIEKILINEHALVLGYLIDKTDINIILKYISTLTEKEIIYIQLIKNMSNIDDIQFLHVHFIKMLQLYNGLSKKNIFLEKKLGSFITNMILKTQIRIHIAKYMAEENRTPFVTDLISLHNLYFEDPLVDNAVNIFKYLLKKKNSFSETDISSMKAMIASLNSIKLPDNIYDYTMYSIIEDPLALSIRLIDLKGIVSDPEMHCFKNRDKDNQKFIRTLNALIKERQEEEKEDLR